MADKITKVVAGLHEERQALASSDHAADQDDQSAGYLTKADARLQNHKLNVYEQQLNQRQSLFASLLALAVLMWVAFVALAGFLAYSERFDQFSVIVLGFMAAMPTALVLGLMRFVYRREDEASRQVDAPKVTDVSAFISALNELIAAAKGLFKKGD
ncbi:MAG: hypothetical protein LWW92_01700 [Rhodocyclales bacterium]|nr:hypothetical protein [Rhodocyclales bacterium]